MDPPSARAGSRDAASLRSARCSSDWWDCSVTASRRHTARSTRAREVTAASHDLRARVRLRHTLVDQRREWQQRIQAVLYHHGVPPRSWLLGAESRAWLAGLALPPAAREQITVALAMIDAIDAQLAPLDQQLRDHARR